MGMKNQKENIKKKRKNRYYILNNENFSAWANW
jgi:hypothetical protein